MHRVSISRCVVVVLRRDSGATRFAPFESVEGVEGDGVHGQIVVAGLGHCNARFFGSAAVAASGPFLVGVAAGRCYRQDHCGFSIRQVAESSCSRGRPR
jgi:hypothetical protein